MLLRTVIPLLIVLACDSAQSYRILGLFPYPGKSHHMVYEPLIKELTSLGHEVTEVSFFPQKEPPENYRHISLSGLWEIHLGTVDLRQIELSYYGLERLFYHVPLVMDLAHMHLQLCEKILYWPPFEEVLFSNTSYDVILTEHFNSDCMLGVVHKLKAPFIGLMSSTFLPWTADRMGFTDNPAFVPGMTLPFIDNMNLLERLENAFYNVFYKIWFSVAIRPKEQLIMQEKFGDDVPNLEDVGRNTSLILINTHYTLTGVKSMVPGMIEIGGIHLNKPKQVMPPNLSKFIDESKDGVILFSMGSLIRGNSMPKDRLEVFLRTFAKFPQRFICKYEDENLDNVPKNVLIIKWAPQLEILKHPKCRGFISHGGLLSLSEAIEAAVPTVTIPILGDQFSNSAAAKEIGLAYILPYKEINDRTLENAITRILTPEMRDSAARASDAWRDRVVQPLQLAVYWVERVARRHGLDRMTSHARHLAWYERALLDVIAIALVVALLVARLLWALFSLITSWTQNTKIKMA